MSFTDQMAAWARDDDAALPCGCDRLIVDTIEETLTCPRRWEYWPDVGWVHVLGGAR